MGEIVQLLHLVEVPDEMSDGLLVRDQILHRVMVVINNLLDLHLLDVLCQHEVSLSLHLLEAFRHLLEGEKPVLLVLLHQPLEDPQEKVALLRVGLAQLADQLLEDDVEGVEVLGGGGGFGVFDDGALLKEFFEDLLDFRFGLKGSGWEGGAALLLEVVFELEAVELVPFLVDLLVALVVDEEFGESVDIELVEAEVFHELLALFEGCAEDACFVEHVFREKFLGRFVNEVFNLNVSLNDVVDEIDFESSFLLIIKCETLLRNVSVY